MELLEKNYFMFFDNCAQLSRALFDDTHLETNTEYVLETRSQLRKFLHDQRDMVAAMIFEQLAK